MPVPSFPELPARPAKPRTAGLTHVIGKGATAGMTSGIIDSAGACTDVWKSGGGTAYVQRPLEANLGPRAGTIGLDRKCQPA